MNEGKEEEIKTKLVRALTAKELTPYLNSIRKMNKQSTGYKIFRQSVEEFDIRYSNAIEVLECIIGKLTALQTSMDVDQELIDVMEMFTYLGIVETAGNSIADIITILLVVNGIDFHIESAHGTPRVRHATSIGSLETERVPLTAKLNFLKENGISTLANLFDSKLRNDIAHSKFVAKEGKIYFKHGRNLKQAGTIARKASIKLFDGIHETYELLWRLAKEEDWYVDKR
jgi:hypothetical protein